MSEFANTSDEHVLRELGQRLARRRLERDLTQAALAEEAGVSKRTVERLESGTSVQLAGWLRVLRALGLLARLDAALPEPTPGPIERLEPRGGEKRRASSGRAREEESDWSWEEDA